ncbi:hypothetical protein EHP00_856 [Ecytonucleospora hepatopenaei]|uniref:Clathrin/coatomer adaptor adaptin-like N-terminal domain-containing protein n=1 Tax=Ecytonucleospora hepatopenaei TaxID=646526 RepID=A0A1W0E4Q7_9MICR|nr:hypothetical protein EHP00_856 [Ecytonucleospora hepatopenaei]
MEKYKKLVKNKIKQVLGGNNLMSATSLTYIHEDLKYSSTCMDAIKTIISMQQQGYDVSEFHGEMVKLMCSTSVEIKRMVNLYLKTNFSNAPANILLYTNSFIKDMRSTNSKIVNMAIQDCFAVSDEVVIKSYVEEFKSILSNSGNRDKKETIEVLLLNMYNLYKINRESFLENKFDYFVIECLDRKNTMYNALVVLSEIEKYEHIVSSDKIISMIKALVEEGDYASIGYALKILLSMKNTDIDTEILVRLLICGDVCIFGTVGQLILLKEGEKYAQMVFDQGLGFLNLRHEQQYNVLKYLYFLIFKYSVKYEESLFVICENDSLDIKRVKFLILSKNISEFAISEIKYLVGRKLLLPEIFEMCINKQIYLPGILCFVSEEEKNKIIEILLRNKEKFIENNSLVFLNWEEDILKFLNTIKPSTQNEQMYLEVASHTCKNIPKFALKLKNNNHQLIRYYLKMRENGFISKDQCINFLNIVKKENKNTKIINLILKQIDISLADNLFPYTHHSLKINFNDLMHTYRELDDNTTRLEIFYQKDKNYNNVINDKDVNNHNSVINDLNTDINYDKIQSDVKQESNCFDLENIRQKLGKICDSSEENVKVELNNPEEDKKEIKKPSICVNTNDSISLTNSEESDNLISNVNIKNIRFDLKCMTGNIFTTGKGIFINVEEINEEQIIYIKINKKVEKSHICTPGTKLLYNLEFDDIGEKVDFIIEDKVYTCTIKAEDLIEEISMDVSLFNKRFGEIERYEILDGLEVEEKFFIDKNKFVFRLLLEEVYGKNFGSQHIIKGNECVLNILKKS